eukprot:6488617-Amphidinium_carterae.1
MQLRATPPTQSKRPSQPYGGDGRDAGTKGTVGRPETRQGHRGRRDTGDAGTPGTQGRRQGHRGAGDATDGVRPTFWQRSCSVLGRVSFTH